MPSLTPSPAERPRITRGRSAQNPTAVGCMRLLDRRGSVASLEALLAIPAHLQNDVVGGAVARS